MALYRRNKYQTLAAISDGDTTRESMIQTMFNAEGDVHLKPCCEHLRVCPIKG